MDDETVLALVLDYLHTHGYNHAENALRAQVDSPPKRKDSEPCLLQALLSQAYNDELRQLESSLAKGSKGSKSSGSRRRSNHSGRGGISSSKPDLSKPSIQAPPLSPDAQLVPASVGSSTGNGGTATTSPSAGSAQSSTKRPGSGGSTRRASASMFRKSGHSTATGAPPHMDPMRTTPEEYLQQPRDPGYYIAPLGASPGQFNSAFLSEHQSWYDDSAAPRYTAERVAAEKQMYAQQCILMEADQDAKDCVSSVESARADGKAVLRYHKAKGSSQRSDAAAAAAVVADGASGRTAPPLYPAQASGKTWDVMMMKVVYQRHHTGYEEKKDFVIKINDIVAGRYQIVDYLGSAAFSRAVQCVDLVTGELVCIKIIKNNKDFFDQSLDEVKLLRLINHAADADAKRVVKLYDWFYFKEHLFIVCELLRDNLYEFSKYNRETEQAPYFTLARLQRITKQCLTALAYVHSLGLIHCDLKPENILIQSYSRCLVKVIDFGSSCFTTDHLASYVQSRSYRAPEVILGLPYSAKIDMWSLGCILAELWNGQVLFVNDSVQTLLARMIGIVGPIPRSMLMQARYRHKYFNPDHNYTLFDKQRVTQLHGTTHRSGSDGLVYLYPKRTSLRNRLKCKDVLFLDFLGRLLNVNPLDRPTAEEAMKHPWLTEAVYSDSTDTAVDSRAMFDLGKSS